MGELCWLALRGRDYPELGPLATAALPGAGAVALSRGAFAKHYAHVDPNEDGALVASAGAARGVLVAVVDGRNGVRASELALDTVRDRASRLLVPDDAAFAAELDALVGAIRAALQDERRSRTCLLLAAVHPQVCRWAGFGDCALFRAAEADQVNLENALVLRPGLALESLPRDRWHGSFARRPGERIAVMSDGVTNFLPEPREVHATLATAPTAAAAARHLARTAMRAGAGDNVAVAVAGA